jgi:hypothetical protein
VAGTVRDTLAWHAQVFAPGLLPPLGDDEAELETPVTASVAIQLTTAFYGNHQKGRLVSVELRNAGPATAVGTAAQPIEVAFSPAAGVQVGSELTILSPGQQTVTGGSTVATDIKWKYSPPWTPAACCAGPHR